MVLFESRYCRTTSAGSACDGQRAVSQPRRQSNRGNAVNGGGTPLPLFLNPTTQNPLNPSSLLSAPAPASAANQESNSSVEGSVEGKDVFACSSSRAHPKLTTAKASRTWSSRLPLPTAR